MKLAERILNLFESKKAIENKSKDTGIPYSILKRVYDRGMAAYANSGSRPGVNSHQWAMARINSFVTGGKTQQTTDKDLWDEYKGKSESIPDKYLSGLSDKDKLKRERELKARANLPDDHPDKYEPTNTDKNNPSQRRSKYTIKYHREIKKDE